MPNSSLVSSRSFVPREHPVLVARAESRDGREEHVPVMVDRFGRQRRLPCRQRDPAICYHGKVRFDRDGNETTGSYASRGTLVV